MKFLRAFIPALTAFAISLPAAADTGNDDEPVVIEKTAKNDVTTIAGWVEFIRLPEHDRRLKTRLDTGAQTASIDATDIEMERREGKRWVSFTVPARDGEEELRLEKPVRRVVRIKQQGDEYDRRYVVDMDICFNGEIYSAEVSLADRSHLNYPMLLGRRFMGDVTLVHSGRAFMTQPSCGNASNG